MKKLLLLLVVLAGLTSCVPPEGCYYERIEVGTEVIVEDGYDFLGRYFYREVERPVFDSILICD